jgi:O-methyltransferase
MNKQELLNKILKSPNKQVDAGIIDIKEIEKLVTYLIDVIDNNVDGDIVELGCYVGESSKFLMRTISETNSNKNLYLYDSFEGLPNLSEYEHNTGWKSGTLKTNENVLINNFLQNELPIPIIHKGWFNEIPEHKLPKKISFAFLDGDFYQSIYSSLEKVYDLVEDGGYIIFHDYERVDLPGVKKAIEDFFKKRGIDYNIKKLFNNLGGIQKNKKIQLLNYNEGKENITLVTGLWDIKRDELTDGWARPFNEHYVTKFKELLKTPYNLIVFGDKEIEKIVKEVRSDFNTQFIYRDLNWFKNNDYYEIIQKIRKDPKWYELSGWLSDSTQAKLEMYNPLVMSKMFLLHDAKILDKFASNYMYWIDAGITNTVPVNYFLDEELLNQVPKLFKKFMFICFPYEANNEIHGFKYDAINRYSKNKVNKVARGGFFGGNIESIVEANSLYYRLMDETLNEGLMGTEESIFTIMTYRFNKLIQFSEIDGNGLIYKFFEDLQNNTLEVKTEEITDFSPSKIVNKITNVGLYVLTFNSPSQFKTLIDSMIQYDSDFINKPEKYLLDNSTDKSTKPEYDKLCEEYNFTYISKGENLGICGGRQYIAEHFSKTNLDAYYFFEDDMFFYPKENEKCRNGFNRMIKNLFNKSNDILSMNGFDFLKLNFSEFYGDNTTQWAWYNVPQPTREKYWPNYNQLPKMGLDPNAPKTKFNNITCYQDVPYADGEIYYCNWPQLVSKEGNKKMFLDTTWAYPHEQTWMSHMFQITKEGKLNPGILLLTPTEHNRFDHYERELRKES